MKKVMEILFSIIKVKSVSYVYGDNDDVQITFPILSNQVELALKIINNIGIGSLFGTYSLISVEAQKDSNDRGMDDSFSATVKSRMVLFQTLVQNISDGADFSFDYVVLLCVAGIIAGSGLATNSAVMVVAAMLVSPLMGPILAMTFGILIHDWQLVMKGLINEIYGLIICVLLYNIRLLLVCYVVLLLHRF